MNGPNDLSYSNDGCATRYLYFKDFQDVNIFIEDQDKEYEYEALFSALIPQMKFKTIFALLILFTIRVLYTTRDGF